MPRDGYHHRRARQGKDVTVLDPDDLLDVVVAPAACEDVGNDLITCSGLMAPTDADGFLPVPAPGVSGVDEHRDVVLAAEALRVAEVVDVPGRCPS